MYIFAQKTLNTSVNMKPIYQKILLSLGINIIIGIDALAYRVEIDGIYYILLENYATVTYQKYKFYQYSSDYKGDVNIPDSVTYNEKTYKVTAVGSDAFSNCSGMTSVTIPESVTSIGDNAFGGCNGLTSITIPNSVTSIGNAAFDGCRGLTSITIPESVTSIGNAAFDGCRGLISVTIPNGVTSIGSFAFYTCSGLTSVTIPNSVTSIGEYAFAGCSGLTSVSIPNSVTSIGDNAFGGCNGLTSITIPNSVTSIGSETFYGCTGLTSITIPKSVTSIGDDAFFGTIWYDNQPEGLVYVGNVAYKYKGKMPEGTKITIEEGTLGIASRAFSDCSGLTSVSIPNSVTSIGDEAFYGCLGLTSVIIPESVTSIGDEAFYGCIGLTSVIIPESVTSIGCNVFTNCSNLKKAEIYSPAERAWGNVFSYCKLDSVIFGGNVSPRLWDSYTVEVAHVIIKEGLTSIGENAFCSCDMLQSITLPSSVSSIGKYAFLGCSRLTSINLPKGLITIDDATFWSCRSLSSVIIPKSVTTIADHAFTGCSNLESIIIPESVSHIGNYAFAGCRGLTIVISLIEDPFPIDESTFDSKTYNTAPLHVPSGSIGAYQTTNGWKNFKNIIELPQEKTFLLLWAKNGSVVAFSLSKKPMLTFTETELHIKGVNIDVTYVLDNLSRFTYETEDYVTPVKDIETEDVSFKLTGESLLFPDLRANSTVSVYSLNGTLVFKKTVQTDGEYSFSLSNLTAGVYLVSVNGITYKIAKK